MRVALLRIERMLLAEVLQNRLQLRDVAVIAALSRNLDIVNDHAPDARLTVYGTG